MTGATLGAEPETLGPETLSRRKATIVVLLVMSAVYALYAVMDVLRSDVGFAPIEILPPLPVFVMLPIWSHSYSHRVLDSRNTDSIPGLPDWMRRLIRLSGTHMVIWWIPVVNLVLPFALLESLRMAGQKGGVLAIYTLRVWAVAWLLACIYLVFWPGATAVQQAFLATAAVAGAATVVSHDTAIRRDLA